MAMKEEIARELRLTCSVGIAPSKYLAKMASGLNKPNGLTVMDREKFREVFFPKPVDALWGIGESTKKSLAEKEIFTVGELARMKPEFLKGMFGKNGFGLSDMSRGIDDSKVLRYREMPADKSMSHETTLREDIQDPSIMKATILWLSDKVARRMRKGGFIGRTISVKVRSSNFDTITRSHTINGATDRCDVIFQQALKLIPKEYGMKTKVRLLGVRVSHLKKNAIGEDDELDEQSDHVTTKMSPQLDMIADINEEVYGKLTSAVDAIRDKFGEHSIKLAGTMRS
jgi:DNA polymerase-4